MATKIKQDTYEPDILISIQEVSNGVVLLAERNGIRQSILTINKNGIKLHSIFKDVGISLGQLMSSEEKEKHIAVRFGKDY